MGTNIVKWPLQTRPKSPLSHAYIGRRSGGGPVSSMLNTDTRKQEVLSL